MRTRTPLAVAIVGALAFAACGSDDSDSADTTPPPATEPVAEEAAAEEEMADEEMSDDEMSDDEMSDDEMSEDEMSEDEMSDDMSEEEMAAAEGDVVVVASAQDDLTTLVAAIEAAGLAETLAGEGPFTIFAPSDEAFEDYLGEMGMTAEDALADPEGLAVLLQGHVVAVADDSEMVASMTEVPFVTLAGTELVVVVDGDTITVGGAEVIEADIFATNGVIHIIDAVIVPA
jgi:pentapeptide MXKDX repeat protein